MIITRSPLRISLGGGGTDLPSYYRKHGGFLIAAAIDAYVYITLHKTFGGEAIIKYSKMERVTQIDAIEHPIIREALRITETDISSFEMASMADIPAGTGLGSSGSFTTALLKALHTFKHHVINPAELAEQACQIELDILKEPIGKQDQYIASFGGLTCFEFHPDDRVTATPLRVDKDVIYDLEDNLLLFFTGYSRSASVILKELDSKSKENDDEITQNLHYVKDIGRRTVTAFGQGDMEKFGALMNEHWEYKKQRSKAMSNPQIDAWYQLAMKNGALGGKLIGAGGGGFLMFYANNAVKLRHALTAAGMQEVRFQFDFDGTRVLVQ